MYAAILRQFQQREASVPDYFIFLFQKYSKLSVNDILKALQVTLSKYRRTFIILDGLNECPVSDSLGSVRYAFLQKIFSLQNEHNVSILATSWIDQEIIACFEAGICMEIQATREDIEQYIDIRMDDLLPFVHSRPDLKQCIKDEFADVAKGMYVYPPIAGQRMTGH